MGAMRLVLDRSDQGLPTEVGIDRLGELLADRENRLWLDISDPGPAEVALLRQTFGFHELVLEDVTRAHERPRCDAYSGYYFIVVYAAEQSGDAIMPQELNLFWGETYLVTIHRRGAAVLTALAERAAVGSTAIGTRCQGSRAWCIPCSRAWWTATS
jgi:magnesium transporter